MTPAAGSTTQAAPVARWLAPVLLIMVVLASAWGSLHWVTSNTIPFGRDAVGYLETTLQYRDFLLPLTLQSIFHAFVAPLYRTPAIYIAAQPFVVMLGEPQDGVVLLNILLHAVVIVLTYGVARQLTDRWTSLFAALLIALLPMMAAMARLFYTEMLLTATVALNLLALYKAQTFTRRGWSLLWGVSAGLGLLMKWTFPIYVLLPLLVVVWQERARLLRTPHVDLRAALWALLPALAFVLLWWLPNRAEAALLPAGGWLGGWWLPLGWLVLTWGFGYSLLTMHTNPRAAAHWLAPALWLAAWLASLWYLPHGNFVQTLLATDVERGSDPLGPFALHNYTRYFAYLYHHHFGALAFWLLVPAALAPWLWQLLHRRRALEPRAALLWWSLLSALVVLVQLSQRNPRNLAPMLPALAVLIALGIAAWPRLLRWLLAALALGALAWQWTLITFDAPYSFSARTAAAWVVNDYALPPASGALAPGYDVAPQLLQRIAEDADGEMQSLGMLVNADYLHRGSLRYRAAQMGVPITVNDLTEADAAWRGLLSSQWVLLKDGDNNNAEVEAQALIARVAEGDALFDALYTVRDRVELPNGEVVTLYQRTGPGFPDADSERTALGEQLAEQVRAIADDRATIIYATPELAVWMGRFDLPGRALVLPRTWNAASEALLAALDGTLVIVRNDDATELAAWIEQYGYLAGTYGDDRTGVEIVGIPAAPLTTLDMQIAWSERGMTLTALRSQASARAGDVLLLEVEFAGADAAAGSKWSVRLVDEAGAVLAANDRPLQATDRFGLAVPLAAAGNTLRVVARAYDGATLQPIRSAAGQEEVYLFDVRLAD